MKLYLIRHGETTGNREQRVQGWNDVRLTEKGEEQAKKLGQRLSKLNFDRIYVSDILRTRQTAALVFGSDAPFIPDARLREINNTVLAGKLRRDIISEYGDNYTNACVNLDFSYFGGESTESLLDRTAAFLRSVQQDTEAVSVAAVTHAGTIHAFVSNVLGAPVNTRALAVANCSVTVLELRNGIWSLSHVNNRNEF